MVNLKNVFFSALRHRIDYTLEGGLVEIISAITSHMAYWESQEFVRFVLKTISNHERDAMYAIGL